MSCGRPALVHLIAKPHKRVSLAHRPPRQIVGRKIQATCIPTPLPEQPRLSSLVGKAAKFQVLNPNSARLERGEAPGPSLAVLPKEWPSVCLMHLGMLRSRKGPSPAGSRRQIWVCDWLPLHLGATLALSAPVLFLSKNKRFMLSLELAKTLPKPAIAR